MVTLKSPQIGTELSFFIMGTRVLSNENALQVKLDAR